MKKLKRRWFKHKDGDGFFYSNQPVAVEYRFYVGEGTTIPTPKALYDKLKEMKHSDESSLSGVSGVYSVTRVDEGTVCDLPPGTYQYLPADYPQPAKLVPIDFRTDKYIKMDGITDRIVSDLNNFMSNESVYRDLEICYKTGVLLYGAAGTGKTALVRHIVKDRLPNDAIVISVGDFLPSGSFLATLKETTRERFKFFILEEFSHFCKDPFDQEALLTFLDGENSVDKSIVFALTNYPEILPPNLVNRHSRIEFMYEVGIPTPEARRALMLHYLKREILDEEINLTDKMTADSIKALCLLTYTKKLSIKDAKTEIENHLKLSKNNFKGRESRLGI